MLVILHATDYAAAEVMRLEPTQYVLLVTNVLDMFLTSDSRFLEALESVLSLAN